MRRLLLAALAFAAVPAVAYGHGFAPHPSPPPAPAPTGTLSVCNVAGARPQAGLLNYTLAAPASAGGSQTFSLAVGSCSPQVFYPEGVAVIVTENVPTGSAVTSIAVSGGASTIASSSPAAGTATLTVGSGQSVLTFTTSGPAAFKPPAPCRVPNVAGLTPAGAKALLVKSHCTFARLTRAYSAVFNAGRVIGTKPKRGLVLAHNAPVDLIVSRGPA